MNPQKIARRIVWAALFLLWLVVILSPCFIFTLATQGEIMITYSDIPNDAFRIWTIQNIGQRGLGIATSRRVGLPDNATCAVVDFRFILWQGKAESSHQCSCYKQQDKRWVSFAEGAEACKLAGE